MNDHGLFQVKTRHHVNITAKTTKHFLPLELSFLPFTRSWSCGLLSHTETSVEILVALLFLSHSLLLRCALSLAHGIFCKRKRERVQSVHGKERERSDAEARPHLDVTTRERDGLMEQESLYSISFFSCTFTLSNLLYLPSFFRSSLEMRIFIFNFRIPLEIW